jgi:Kef-type K+ transport system membrane component KefB
MPSCWSWVNVTEYGKSILAACFVNDLGTVIALGLIFSLFTVKTMIFVGVCVVLFAVLPFVTRWFFRKYGGRVSELETKYILFLLFALGGLAVWAGSEAVLPAYMIDSMLAGTVGKDHMLIRRMRTLTFGLLTPFYFIRAGSFVSVPALVAAPATLLILFLAKTAGKTAFVFPTVRAHQHPGSRWHLLHPDDVNRPHLRHHCRALRTESPDHHPGAILVPGWRSHRQRCHPHSDCQYVFPSPPPPASQARK